MLKDVRYRKAQKMLKCTFNALIQQHTAEKDRPTLFRTATVRPKRWGPNILYNTSLNTDQKELCGYLAYLSSYIHLSHGIFL